MKRILVTIVLLSFWLGAAATSYNVDHLKKISVIWGEVYLFHPFVVRVDKQVEWEKVLVEFLPLINNGISDEELIDLVNCKMLSRLDDPFTRLQSNRISDIQNDTREISNASFDYLKIPIDYFSNVSSVTALDSLITDRCSEKPLVIDVRIADEIRFDYHKNAFMDYFATMLIEKEISGGVSVSREHLGWNEYNDRWFYEQRWKVNATDWQSSGNGIIKPFSSYTVEINQYIPDFDWDNYKAIHRPIYFLTNNTFLSYYAPLMLALRTQRDNLYVINEDRGRIFTHQNNGFISYPFDKFDFILNSNFTVNQGVADLMPDFNSRSVNSDSLAAFIHSKPQTSTKTPDFSFTITPKKYVNAPDAALSKEEKILGVMKIWTLVKYFYAHPNLCNIDWEASLGQYLDLAQNTNSDKEYFTLIKEMMSHLNDSHVSTFHPSVFDFSSLFVAPVNFEQIKDRVIVTSVDSSITSDIKVGDEIVSIDGLTINEILENEKKTISSSNNQGLISVVINPSYFNGAKDSMIKLGIKRGRKNSIVDVSRNMYIFQFMSMKDNRAKSKVFDANIGYLNLASYSESNKLESDLRNMGNTSSLIIDLRNSYPISDYEGFLSMLFNTKSVVRLDQTPVLSADGIKRQTHIAESVISPDPSFSYQKPIAVLIDKTMISRPEDIAICLKTLPNVTFVGEQTQGTDGEMTKVFLPGGGETSFTEQVVKFADGGDFQGVGIIPTIKVDRTMEGVKESRDEILETAIQYCKRITSQPKP